MRILVAAVLVVTLAAGTAAAQSPVKIRWGAVGGAVPSDITPIIFANKSILKHWGHSYTVEVQSFNGSSLIIPALASKNLDFAMLATFIGIVVPMLKNRPQIAATLVAGLVALLCNGLPYKLGLMAAALSGIAVGIVLERRASWTLEEEAH